jgi:hypothetical protein
MIPDAIPIMTAYPIPIQNIARVDVTRNMAKVPAIAANLFCLVNLSIGIYISINPIIFLVTLHNSW